MTEFARLADVLDSVSTAAGRIEKVNLIAGFLGELPEDDIKPASLFLAGRIFPENDQRTLDVSWSGLLDSVRQVIDFSDEDLTNVYKGDTGDAIAALLSSAEIARQESLTYEPLTIEMVATVFSAIADSSGKGSKRKKENLMAQLISDSSPREAKYLVAFLLSDTRTGVSEGLLAESIATAFGIDPETVRRAWYFSGDLGWTALAAKTGGSSSLEAVAVELFRPVKPMLATPAMNIRDLLAAVGEPLALELKMDGARVQIHKDGQRVRVFSRSLADVTESLPEITQVVQQSIRSDKAILDGEVIAVGKEGRPYPFQVVMTRFGRVQDVETKVEQTRLELHLFDALMIDGISTVDRNYIDRHEMLARIGPPALLTESLVTSDVKEAETFFKRSRDLGHEGIVAKRLDSAYVPGVRGRNWFKVKHTLDTFDLVIIAAEWGYGRRSQWLSDYHLAVRNEDTGEYVMVGKTFKGLTDTEFKTMTDRLLAIQIGGDSKVVRVRPEVVVQVLASDIQDSQRYDAGMTLRFARISAIRDDKRAEDATTLAELRRAYDAQFRRKAK
jgi:DNA ligase-1